MNDPLEILFGLVLFGGVAGFVVHELPMTFPELLARALEHWFLTVPIALTVVLLILFGDTSGSGGVDGM